MVGCRQHPLCSQQAPGLVPHGLQQEEGGASHACMLQAKALLKSGQLKSLICGDQHKKAWGITGCAADHCITLHALCQLPRSWARPVQFTRMPAWHVAGCAWPLVQVACIWATAGGLLHAA